MQHPDALGWDDPHADPVNTQTPPPSQRPPEATRLPSSESGRLLPPEPSESGRVRWSPEVTGWEPSAYVVELSDQSFARQVLESRIPVVVDFWAEQCVPCRRQEEALQALGERYFGRLRVGRINVYRNPETTKRYRIQGVPHLLVVRNGEVIQELVGDHTLEALERTLTRFEIL